MIILVDQDGVLADFDESFFARAEEDSRLKGLLTAQTRSSFAVEDDYPQSLEKIVKEVYHVPGFFLNMKPVPGAIDGIKALKNLGHEVFICTSPLTRYDPCILEKYQWVDKYLGQEWIKRMIPTKDKTVIHGDFLIDDNPLIKGVMVPSWKHIIYDAPVNRSVIGQVRITWDSLDKFLCLL